MAIAVPKVLRQICVTRIWSISEPEFMPGEWMTIVSRSRYEKPVVARRPPAISEVAKGGSVRASLPSPDEKGWSSLVMCSSEKRRMMPAGTHTHTSAAVCSTCACECSCWNSETKRWMSSPTTVTHTNTLKRSRPIQPSRREVSLGLSIWSCVASSCADQK